MSTERLKRVLYLLWLTWSLFLLNRKRFIKGFTDSVMAEAINSQFPLMNDWYTIVLNVLWKMYTLIWCTYDFLRRTFVLLNKRRVFCLHITSILLRQFIFNTMQYVYITFLQCKIMLLKRSEALNVNNLFT